MEEGLIVSNAVNGERLSALSEREAAAFRARIGRSLHRLEQARQVMPDGVPMAWMVGLYGHPPIFVGGGHGSNFEDIDGNLYIDFNLADLSNTIGYGANPVSERLAAQAARGIQHLLPTEDAIAVARELRRRTGFPYWQFTLSASGANTEAIRIARAFTRREKIVVFEGKYHGHIDITMVDGDRPEAMGISTSAARDTLVIPFNDPAALATALSPENVALVLTEPALTNCTLVLPEPGFLQTVGDLCRQTGTLLCLDETHTWQFAFGGMTRAHGLTADLVTLGKGLGTGAPLGAYGMSGDLGNFLEEHRDYDSAGPRGLAIGGTTYGNALTMAAVRAGLEEILTEEAYARTAALGARLADGIDELAAAHTLPWRAFRYGPRSGFCLTPELPRNYREAVPSLHPGFSAARRLYMANRGIWDAINAAGPQVSFAHSAADIDRYVETAAQFLAEVTAR
jgi:glutamate-1-semialdehyde 2,1-aminomutase